MVFDCSEHTCNNFNLLYNFHQTECPKVHLAMKKMWRNVSLADLCNECRMTATLENKGFLVS